MNILFIIIGILLFNFVVIAHEWGHYFTAKSFGVKVNEFAIGMGPKIFKIQRGETLFSIRAFPMGGFCAMEGEDEKSEDTKAFDTKKPWQKIIITAMGAIMNFILGFLITLIVMMQRNAFISTTISKFSENSLSQSSGLQIGDKITKVDGTPVFTYKDIIFVLSLSEKTYFDICVERNGEKINLSNVEFGTEENQSNSKKPSIDFSLKTTEKNFFTLISQTILENMSAIQITWKSLLSFITGKISLNLMSGPIGIASAMGQATSEGLKTSFMMGLNNLLSLIAMITINLGIINLLPLPALDGGRLVFLFFELITGKKVNQKYEGIIHTIGFILFIILAIFISYNDILRLLKKN